MFEPAFKLAQKLQVEGQKSHAFFQAIPSQDWQTPIYTEGAAWQVHQILAHFASAEASILQLAQEIVAGQDGLPSDFDLDTYNEQQAAVLALMSREELLQLFLQARSATVAFVEGLQAGDLERQGRHPWLGLAKIEDILKLMYRHNQIHQRDIRRALEV